MLGKEFIQEKAVFAILDVLGRGKDRRGRGGVLIGVHVKSGTFGVM